MTWSHLTGACSDTDEMLTDLADWLESLSVAPFTKEPVGGAGVYKRSGESITVSSVGTFSANLRCLSRDGVRYWLAHNELNGIFAKLSVGVTSITGSAPTYDSMTSVSGGNHSRNSRCYPVSGANKYWFFASDDQMQIHVRFRRANGSWQAFSMGKINKPDDADWDGGEFFAPQCASTNLSMWASAIAVTNVSLFGCSSEQGVGGDYVDIYSSGVLRVVFSGQNWGLMSFGPATDINEAMHFSSKICIYGGLRAGEFGGDGGIYVAGNVNALSPNIFNGRSVGVPIDLYLYDHDSTLKMLYLGNVPGIRFVGLGTMAAEQLINDDWVVFPQTSAGAGDPTPGTGYPTSGNIGVAYYCPGI